MGRRLGLLTFAFMAVIVAAIGVVIVRMQASLERPPDLSAPPAKLTLYHHFLEEGARKWLDIGSARFMEQYPDIRIEVKAENANTYANTLHNLVAMERMPDVYMTDSIQMLKEFIDAGYAMDLTGHSLIRGMPQDLLRGVQDERGHVWAMPLDRNGVGVFYHREAFAKAGIAEIPRTWPEFLDACRKLEQAGIQPLAAGYKDVWTLSLDLQPDVIASGIGQPDWLAHIEAGKISFADHADLWNNVLRRLAERFPYTGSAPFETRWDEALAQLASGQAAMIINGTWTIDGVRSYKPDADIGLFAFPATDDPQDARFALKTTGGFVVNPKSANADLAVRLVEYFSTPEMARVFQDNKKAISVLADTPIDFDPAYAELDRLYIRTDQTIDYSMFYPDFVNVELIAAFRSEIINFLYDPAHDADRCIAALDEAFDRVRPRV